MNKKEKEILAYTAQKVEDWFKKHPAPGHSFGHAERVGRYAARLAKAHGGNIFLSTISGLLHDLGRSDDHQVNGKTHHEISYDLCRQWFREDAVLKKLSREEKITILYAVRNHWNNMADDFWEAVLLRDADKLDLFGPIGLERGKEHRAGDWDTIQRDFRFMYDCFYWLRTPTAKKLARGKKYIQWSDWFYKKFLRARAKPVEL